jgi:hypothetical protein
MAKLQYIKAYEKAQPMKDENGETILDAFGRPTYSKDRKQRLKPMHLYGFLEYTEEELDQYKESKMGDNGEDWYKETEGGIPLFHSDYNYGNIIQLNLYFREDGTPGFAVDNTDIINIQEQMEEFKDFPEIVRDLAGQLRVIKTRGERMDVDAVEKKLAAKNKPVTPVKPVADEQKLDKK